jgi:protein-S-isoprenylcysteine O-methyltransferase Ste14
VILGQALLFASLALLEYAALVWVFFHTFVLVYEEPTLGRTFGAEYERFRAQVPRWIPRVTGYRQDG